MSPGHLIPMIDMARLFAAHGVKATIITTPLNVSRFQSILDRDQNSRIHLLVLDFPNAAADIPENCKNLDSLPSRSISSNFSKAVMMLQPQSDQLVHQHHPGAIISDFNLPWTAEIPKSTASHI
ncbi:hypothetical protein L1049_009106 [Liquidambar formosana]|uniref:Uncharacterized protein n=1 Tax=Liquidambar formosana TaxID=63359 RepID=A0AAP0SAG6_LIQFO